MTIASEDSPVVREMDKQWFKVVAILMYKAGLRDVEITTEDIVALGSEMGVVADTRGGRFFVRLRRRDELEELEKNRPQP